jgi:hypothetical protein
MAQKFNVSLDVTIKVNTSYEVNAKNADAAKEIAQAAAIARLRAEHADLTNSAYLVESRVVSVQ